MRKYLLATVALIFSVHIAWGATYCVNVSTGNNTNSGISPDCWQYLPGSVGETGWPNGSCGTPLCAGDTVQLTGGQTWTKAVAVGSGNYENGTSGNEVIITTTDEDITNRAVIAPSGSSQFGIHVSSRNYIIFKYLEIGPVSYSSGNSHGFWIETSNNISIYYSYSHDISDNGGGNPRDSYALTCHDGIGGTIAYNVFEDADQKVVECYDQDDMLFHHNIVRINSDWTGEWDHLMVVTRTSSGWQLYDNIFIQERGSTGTDDPECAFKFDGTSPNFPDDNDFYNNIIINAGCGIRLIDAGLPAGQGNRIVGNYVYGADVTWIGSSAGDRFGIALCNGPSNCYNNTVENNVIYETPVNGTFGTSGGISTCAASSTCANNTVRNNYIAHATATVEFFVRNVGSQTNAEMESNWNGANGNVWTGNLVNTLSGVTGGAHPISNLPDSFNTSWEPNNTGLTINASSPLYDAGVTLGSPFNTDILGISRPQGGAWDIGAYEFSSSTPTVTVTATKANASEPGSNGEFTLSCDLACNITVQCSIGGTATENTDYMLSPSSCPITIINSLLPVTVSVIDDAEIESVETVTMTLMSGTGYTVGSPAGAQVVISDNDISRMKGGMISGSFR